MEKVITCLTGPSLSGKTTITDMLTQYHDIIVPKHITTREPRIDDKKGFYDYITLEKFVSLLEDKKLLIGSTDGIRGYGVTYYDCLKAFEFCETILIHASYKDIEQLKRIVPKVRLVALTYKNLEDSMRQRFLIENKNRTDIDYRLASAVSDHTKYFEEVRQFAQEVVYTDKNSKQKTYEIVCKSFGYIPYKRERIR